MKFLPPRLRIKSRELRLNSADYSEIFQMSNQIYLTNLLFVQKISKTGNVSKMTDASQYTGSHKERFDASGKGKGQLLLLLWLMASLFTMLLCVCDVIVIYVAGLDGRADRVENSGYVGNYKGQGTFEKK